MIEKITIVPNDVLLFRESRPFFAGESHVARSLFPLPQTIAGALRSFILVNGNFSEKAKKCAGYKKEEPEFEIVGVFPVIEGEEVVATPINVVKNNCKISVVKPGEFKDRLFLPHEGKPAGGFIPFDMLMKILSEKIDNSIKPKKIPREKRIGIALDSTKTALEGHLYTVEFLRMDAISVWIKDWCWEKRGGTFKVGGESRFASFYTEPLELSFGSVEGKRLFLYFATPTILGRDAVDSILRKIEDVTNGRKPQLHLSVFGKPIPISGWDYAKNKPKGVKHAIPPGSLFFMGFDAPVALPKYLKLGALTKLGYGLTFVGVW